MVTSNFETLLYPLFRVTPHNQSEMKVQIKFNCLKAASSLTYRIELSSGVHTSGIIQLRIVSAYFGLNYNGIRMFTLPFFPIHRNSQKKLIGNFESHFELTTTRAKD